MIGNGSGDPSWRKVNVVGLSIAAAIFTAIYKTMDNITMHNFIISHDQLSAVYAYLIVGGWTGVLCGVIFATLLGKRLIDSEFNGFVIDNPSMHWSAFVSGTISAGSTLFLLWGNKLGDPSIMIALGNLTLVYTMLYDVITKQATLRQIALPTTLVTIGGILATFGGPISTTILAIFIVVILSNGLGAITEVVEQHGTKRCDGVNFFVWRFFWLALSGTIIAVTTSLLRGTLTALSEAMLEAIRYLPWIALTMFFVFLGIGLKLTAKKHGAISLVLITLSAQVILGYAFTIPLNHIFPGLFGDLTSNPLVWSVRIVGGILIVAGIFRLRK